MGFRWPGFRKVRGQVCKRVGRRLKELGLDDRKSYRDYLRAHPDEWEILDGFCRITISRFFRDRRVYETLGNEALPELARRCGSAAEVLSVWSAGCGAGEEPYSISILHRLSEDPDLNQAPVRILATDSDRHQLARASEAVYPVGCTRDVPSELREEAFEPLEEDQLRLRAVFRHDVDFEPQDIRREIPDGPFHVVLCRNLAFTYFIEETQREILADLHRRLEPAGYLVIGTHERLPAGGPSFEALPHCPAILRRA